MSKKWSEPKGKIPQSERYIRQSKRNAIISKIVDIDVKIDKIPSKEGHVDYNNPRFKRLSNQRAKLYDELHEI